jgi:HlyD family secretion protein
MSIFRWVLAAVLVALVGMAAIAGLKPRPRPPITVHKTVAVKSSLTRTVSGAGKLEPARKINVSCNITGELLDLKVGIGSVVKKGDYLGQVDTSRYTAIVAQQRAQLQAARNDQTRAESRLAQLKRTAARMDQLAGKDAVGLSDVDDAHSMVSQAEADLAAAQSRVQQAQAVLQEATRNVEWATLKAPDDGTVLAVNHRVGERVRGSDFSEDVVVVIGSVNQMEVRIEVGEFDVVWIKPGQVATVELDALPDKKLKGHVIDSGRDAIVRNAGTDNEVTTFPVWIALDEDPPVLLSGMSAHVDIQTDTKDGAVAVPIQAVTVRPRDDGKSDGKDGKKPAAPAATGSATANAGSKDLDKVVFVIDGTTVHRRKVETGLASDTMIEVTSGLKEGETIVEGPYRTLARQLQDGDQITVEDAPAGVHEGAR